MLTNALATAATSLYDLIAVAHTDTTNLQLLQTHLTSQGAPLVGRGEQGIYCSTASLATSTTQWNALNEGLIQSIWHQNGEDLNIVVAAAWGATRAIAESANPAVNLSSFNMVVVDLYPVVHAPANQGLYTTDSQAAACLDAGGSPIQVTADGHAYVARSITTHSQDSSGNPDTRQLDTVNPTVSQMFIKDLSVQIPSQFQGKNLIDDPVESDDETPSTVTTPKRMQAFCSGIATTWARFGWLDATQTKLDLPAWYFSLAPSSPGRVNATMPIHPAQWLVQFSGQVRALS